MLLKAGQTKLCLSPSLWSWTKIVPPVRKFNMDGVKLFWIINSNWHSDQDTHTIMKPGDQTNPSNLQEMWSFIGPNLWLWIQRRCSTTLIYCTICQDLQFLNNFLFLLTSLQIFTFIEPTGSLEKMWESKSQLTTVLAPLLSRGTNFSLSRWYKRRLDLELILIMKR
jgi:hypothetical protein